jgi:hypothetical protein
MNEAVSTGLLGSWYRNWSTSSCRNAFELSWPLSAVVYPSFGSTGAVTPTAAAAEMGLVIGTLLGERSQPAVQFGSREPCAGQRVGSR